MSADSYPHACPMLKLALEERELGLRYNPRFREYGLEYRDGGSSFQLLYFCPFCGAALPGSLRDAWFERLDSLGLDVGDDVPEDLVSDSWWKDRRGVSASAPAGDDGVQGSGPDG